MVYFLQCVLKNILLPVNKFVGPSLISKNHVAVYISVGDLLGSGMVCSLTRASSGCDSC